MSKNEIVFITDLLEKTKRCGDEIQLDCEERKIVNKCIKEIWKIKAYDNLSIDKKQKKER